jgi:hypothetical protein
MAILGDFLKSINTKSMIVDDIEVEHDYNPFVINRTLSYFMDTVLYANEMNRYPNASNLLQYKYLYHAVKKRRRYSKWTKPENNEDVKLIQDYYKYNRLDAEIALKLMPKSEVDRIRNCMQIGGV